MSKGYVPTAPAPDWSYLLYVFPTRSIVNFLTNFAFFTATYFSKAQYSLFVLKVPSNQNQSIRRRVFLVAASEIWNALATMSFYHQPLTYCSINWKLFSFSGRSVIAFIGPCISLDYLFHHNKHFIWNCLPTDLRQSDLLYCGFRQSPETFFFGQLDRSAVRIHLTAH